MSLLYLSRRNGTQMLLKSLSQPSSSAAMTSTAAAGGSPIAESILGPADAHTHRRWSHYAASTSFSSSNGQFSHQTRAFSVAAGNSSGSGNQGGGGGSNPAAATATAPLPRRVTQDTVSDGKDPNPLPPGAALKRVEHNLDSLNSKESDLPPWQAASRERLSQELLEYRNDLASAKTSVTAARRSSNKPSLPFIGEAFSVIVDAERAALASPYSNFHIGSNGDGGGKKFNNINNLHNVSARSVNKRMGFAQLRAILDMVPGQDGQRSGTSSQLYDQMWTDSNINSRTTAASAVAAAEERIFEREEEVQEEKTTQQLQRKRQESRIPKPVGADEAQTLLAAKANEVIGVLTAVELLLPLAPWQRRLVSRAVVESRHTQDRDDGENVQWIKSKISGKLTSKARSPSTTTAQPEHSYKASIITSHSARTAVSFLLSECGLTHRQAAHAIAEHPWLLGIENIRIRCSGLLESLNLLNMDAMSVAAVVAAHPPALLMNADKDIIPLLEYLNGLGFHEEDAAELIRAAPRLLLDPIAKQRLAGCVAFWVGQGMSRQSLRSLLTAAPEVTSMSLRLLQLKTEWLMEQAGFTIEDFAKVPAAVLLPLAAHVAPRLAFARHRGYTVDPPSVVLDTLNNSSNSNSDSLSMESLLSSSEIDFLKSVGNATDAEFRGFEAAWRDSDLNTWFKSRLSGPSVTQYENMEWMDEEEMQPLRAMHDHHVALREIAWEQQQDREKEWETVWGDWKRAQTRRDQLETWTRRMKKRREDEAMRRATIEMTMLAESQGVRRPGMCLKSPYCNRKINHPGMCNQKLALKMNFNVDDYTNNNGGGDSSGSGELSYSTTSTTPIAENEVLNTGNIGRIGISLGPGGLRGQTIHEVATISEVDAGLYLFGNIKNDVPADEDTIVESSTSRVNVQKSDLSNNTNSSPTSINTNTNITTTTAATTGTSTGSASSEGYLFLGDGPTITKEEIENQDIDQVLQCFTGLEALLERAPHGVLSHRTVNAWADRQGYSRAVSTAAKGVLAATGTARVVVEPNFQYHKVAPKAWQLLHSSGNSSSNSNGSLQPSPRLTRTAANVAVLSNLVIKMIDSLPDGVIERKDLRSWAEVRWKGSSKLHLRAVVAGLLEQGLVVQRRRKGISSGPMEVAQVDLKRYLQGLSQHYSSMSVASSSLGAKETLFDEENIQNLNSGNNGGGVFEDNNIINFNSGSNSSTAFSALSNSNTITKNITNTITGEHSHLYGLGNGIDHTQNQSRMALIRRVRFTEDDWTRFENLPPHQVRSCIDGLLDLLRAVPDGVPHKMLASWAAQQGYDKETLTAAKGVMFTEGTASVCVQPNSAGGAGNMPQKIWLARENHNFEGNHSRFDAVTSELESGGLPLYQMLQTVREARGGFLTKGELRTWAKEYMGQNWQGVAALNLAIATLIESGCLVQLGALPLVDGKKSKLLVAVDLRQYLDQIE